MQEETNINFKTTNNAVATGIQFTKTTHTLDNKSRGLNNSLVTPVQLSGGVLRRDNLGLNHALKGVWDVNLPQLRTQNENNTTVKYWRL